MYHAHFRGTHYEAGFRWGSLLLKHKNIILENIPFEITQERIDYALSCLPIYEKYYHEIMEEIQGLADGQQCDVRILQAVLFSMYSMPPSCNCSCFAFTTEHEILLGRNSDFLTEIERLNQNVVYKLTDGVYSFTGNTTAFVEIEDGVNEHGLAVGLTSVYPNQCKPGFNAGMIVRYLLEKCKNVSEAVSCLYQLPIASAQTLTLADAMGTITVIECNAEQIKVEKTLNNNLSFVCATNTFHFPEMMGYNNDKIDNWFAEERYQTLYSAFNRKNGGFNLPFAEKLLSGDYGFLCQYDRSTGKDTVWSVIYDTRCYEHIFLLTKSKKYFYDAAAIAEPLAPTTAARYRTGRSAGQKYADEVPGQGNVQGLNRARSGSYYDEALMPTMRNRRDVWLYPQREYGQ